MNANARTWVSLFIAAAVSASPLAFARTADPAAETAAFTALTDQADLLGEVPVLVELAVTPEAPDAAEVSASGSTRSARAMARLARQQLRIDRAQARVLGRLSKAQRQDAKRFSYVPFVATSGDAETLRQLREMPEVVSIQEDGLNFPDLTSSLPSIGANVARAKGWTGEGQAIAILDTGVDNDHAALVGNIIQEAAACFSGTSTWWATSLCNTTLPRCVSSTGTQITNSACGVGAGNYCSSGCDHGTHVAGIAAGSGSLVTGVAPEAGIIPVQVFVKYDYDGNGSLDVVAYDSDIIAGLEYVLRLSASYNIAAVNMSLGGGVVSSTATCDSQDAAMKAAIDNLRAVGIPTVIAAGNNGSSNGISSPGCISTAVSVGATDDAGVLASYSNESAAMTVTAPGSSISSAVPDDKTETWNGTSMATPHVAGAMALLKQKAAALGATVTVDNLVAALQQTGAPITSATFQVPRIDVTDALDSLASIMPESVVMDTQVPSLGGASTLPTATNCATAASRISAIAGTLSSQTTSKAFGGSALRDATVGTHKAVCFKPVLPRAGQYDVYGFWPEATTLTAQVQHANGATPLSVSAPGAQWHWLGTFAFAPGAGYYVELQDASGGALVADALRFDLVLNTAPVIESLSVSKQALMDTEAAILTAEASDLDGGPEPLNYQWSVLTGGGSINSASTQDATYIPANLTGPEPVTVTLEVVVSDGAMTAAQTVTLKVYDADAAPEIVIDNDDPETSSTGNWGYGTGSGTAFGGDLRYGLPGQVNAYRFSPSLPRDGCYEVFARWISATNRSTTVVIDIRSEDGISTKTVNQQINNNQWVSLGDYPFAAGTKDYVEISDRNGVYAIADAVMFRYVGALTAPAALQVQTTTLNAAMMNQSYSATLQATGGVVPYRWSLITGALPAGLTLNAQTGVLSGISTVSGTFSFTVAVTDANGQGETLTQALTLNVQEAVADIIIDNDAAGTSFTGQWASGIGYGRAYGGTLRYGLPGQVNTYRFTPTIASAGRYEVFTRWVAASHFSKAVVVATKSADGLLETVVNQTVAGDQWNSLGVHAFSLGTNGYVEISDHNGVYAIADAVMFRYVGALTAPAALQVQTTTLNAAMMNQSYSATLQATGGVVPYQWSLTTGALPAGLTLDAQSGVLSGIPSVSGAFSFTVAVTDANGQGETLTQALTLNVQEAVADIIIDNDAAGTSFTGQWASGIGYGRAYGGTLRYGLPGQVNTYRFTPTIASAGRYEVFTRWVAASHFSKAVVVATKSADGLSQTTVNQTLAGDQWNSLGVHAFAVGADGYVEISDPNGVYAIADAVRLVYRGL